MLMLTLPACTTAPAGEPRPPAEPVDLPSATEVSPTPAPQPSPSPVADLPGPDEPIPEDPAAIAAALADATERVHAAVDRWRDAGNPSTPGIPEDVELLALYQQRITRGLAKDIDLWKAVRPHLPDWLRNEAATNVGTAAALYSIVTPISGDSTFETQDPPAAGELLRYFREAEDRFGVDWELLAAVCYIESKFARVLSASTAGAQGPMQFIPSTWDAYGMGGDVHDPHDAILGAANYLHASGAPGDERAALFAYNHSDIYVDAVLAYANQIRADPNDYFVYYSWQVFVLTTEGDRRLTGPGL